MLKEIKCSDIHLSYQDIDMKDVKEGTEIIGQERALGLLRLGLSVNRSGYNIFLSGEEGSGRLTAVKNEIKRIENDTESLFDAAYVYSQAHPDCPTCIKFQKGMAREFQKDLHLLRDKAISKSDMEAKWNDEAIRNFLRHIDSSSDPIAYDINIVLDRANATRRPLVIETHPSKESLFGFIDDKKVNHMGIHIGSYQEAAGGFLVLNAEEIASNEELFSKLKRYLEMTHRALTSTAVKGEMLSSLRPSPIPMLTKVILIGNEDLYDHLSDEDKEFLRFFKISPEFDYSMDATKENILGTVSYLKEASKELPIRIDDSAYKEVLRFSSFVAEDRKKLTTELRILSDLIEEAAVLALSNNEEVLTSTSIRNALEKRDWFGSMAEDHINDEIENGVMVMNLKGKRVGVVNGLAVMDRGLTSFGTPTVISVAVAPGTEGIVNIEHEAGLSGGIHDKGVMILEGYLRGQYARTFPLSLYAGICFEQSYGEVDGDSASSAELYALLSAIGNLPLRQDIAVTGSVNQMGELQPVGGINEKIQGFFNACSRLGLTGTQGVIIPQQNLSSLILPYNVEEAIEQGLFHIYAISDIHEGLELLTGLKGGQRDRKGIFPQGTYNRAIEDSLKALCHNSQKQN